MTARLGRRFTYRAGGWAGEGLTVVGERQTPAQTRVESPAGTLAVARHIQTDPDMHIWFLAGGARFQHAPSMIIAELAACRAVLGDQ